MKSHLRTEGDFTATVRAEIINSARNITNQIIASKGQRPVRYAPINVRELNPHRD